MTKAPCPVCATKGWVVDEGGNPVKCHGCDGAGTVEPEEAARRDEQVDDPRVLEE